MDPPGFDYAALLHRALRGMVKQVLSRVAREGLPGDHHFYLTLHTNAPGVALSEAMRRQHPKEMTIVLQHQYSGLEVAEESFSVTLRFGGVPTRLTVPFEALTAFVDPSVSFGVRLATEERPIDEKDAPPAPTTRKKTPPAPKPRARRAKVVAFKRPGGE